MQKDVAILLRIGGATGRNILAGILKRIKEHPANLGHIRTDDGEIGFKAADYLRSLGKFRRR